MTTRLSVILAEMSREIVLFIMCEQRRTPSAYAPTQSNLSRLPFANNLMRTNKANSGDTDQLAHAQADLSRSCSHNSRLQISHYAVNAHVITSSFPRKFRAIITRTT